jgi:hypothetical protein
MRPVGAELFRMARQSHIQTDGQTDSQDEDNGPFSQLCEDA